MDKRGWMLLLCGLLALAPAWAQFTEEQLSNAEADEAFLAEAEQIDEQRMSLSEGVTQPYRLTLSDGSRTEFAVWKDVKGRVGGAVEGWNYEIAAYRIDRYLGLNMVPTTVERRRAGTRGSCQLWIEGTLLRDDPTMKPPPDKARRWNNNTYLQRAFDNLIANTDRHTGNILITDDYRMVLIDHSRSFRSNKWHRKNVIFTEKHKEGVKIVKRLPRGFVEKLRALDLETLNSMLGDYLLEPEISAILERRDIILARLQARIDEFGEDQILY